MDEKLKVKIDDELMERLMMPPGKNGYGALFECPYCHKVVPKTGLLCDNCGKKIFDQ